MRHFVGPAPVYESNAQCPIVFYDRVAYASAVTLSDPRQLVSKAYVDASVP